MDPQADVHTEDENEFGVDVLHANEEFDINIGLWSVRKGIAGKLRVIVVVKLVVVVGWIGVGECWRHRCRMELMADEEVTIWKEAASKDRQATWCVRKRKDVKDRMTAV